MSAMSEHEQAEKMTQDGYRAIQQMTEQISKNPEIPWSTPVTQARERARQIFLTVLFKFPSSPLAHNINNLWIQTTHTYLKSLSSAVNHAHNAVIATTPPGTQARGNKANQLWHARRQYRTVLQRDVEFYHGLIDRIVRFYKLQDLVVDSLDMVDIVVSDRASEDGNGPEILEAERKDRRSLVYDTLIHLGDLERYRSQLDDREMAPDGMGPPGQVLPVKPAHGAEDHYLAALSLIRDNGHTYNSLAIVAEAEHLDSKAIYYYIRASIVRKPFKGIEAVLSSRFKKRLIAWEENRKWIHRNDSVPVQIQYLNMMAMLYSRQGLSSIPDLEEQTAEDLSHDLWNKKLPSADIVKLTISLIGIHAHTRQNAMAISRKDPSWSSYRDAYELALAILISEFRILCEVAIQELNRSSNGSKHDNALADDDDDSETDTDHDKDLATQISSVLRRLLPSMRIMSKWLKCNLDHLGRHVDRSNVGDIAGLWEQYTNIVVIFAGVFPIYRLPSLMGPLEEDVELRGFPPLAKASTGSTTDPYHARTSDEEQLMRISDFSVEARLIMQQAVGHGFVRQKTLDRLALLHKQPEPPVAAHKSEASMAVSSAEDAPAYRRDSGPSDEDDEEIIVYTPSGRPPAAQQVDELAPASNPPPVPAPVPAPAPVAPQVLAPAPMLSAPVPAFAPPGLSYPSALPQQRPITAMDLLEQITRGISVNETPSLQSPFAYGRAPAPSYPAYPTYPVHTPATEGLYGAEATMWTLTREESEEGIRRSLSQSGQGRSGQYQNQNQKHNQDQGNANNNGSTMKSIDSGPSLLRPDPWSPTSMSMSRSTSIQSQARPPPRARPALWPTTLVEDLYWLAGREAV